MPYPSVLIDQLPPPSSNLKGFYLVRHGLTDLNEKTTGNGPERKWIAQGRGTNVAINKLGRQQALDLNPLHTTVDLRRVICSPQLRAVETASISGLTLLKDFETSKLIEERDYGELEGKFVGREVFEDNHPGCEDILVFALRLIEAVEKYACTAGTVFVTHGGVNDMLAQWLKVKLGVEHRGNGSFLHYDPRGSAWSVTGLKVPAVVTSAENQGRVALISGATKGIGLNIAKELYKAGFNLSLGGRDVKKLAEIFGQENERLHYASFDALIPSTCEKWITSVVAKFGRIDVLVNNAGHSELKPFQEVDQACLQRHMDVNLTTPLRLSQLCMPYLEKCKEGRIIFIGSMSGVRAANSFVAYNTSKAAVRSLCQTISYDYWDKGIRATVISPGFVNTGMSSYTNMAKPEEMISVETVASEVRSVIELPNTAAKLEVKLLCRKEAWWG